MNATNKLEQSTNELETSLRSFICRKCETVQVREHTFQGGNNSLLCERCNKGPVLIIPLQVPYPTYRPGTKLSEYQKETRHLLRRWSNGWVHERRQMLKQCGIIPERDYDQTDASNDIAFRMCSAKSMPIKVFKWYWVNHLPQFISQDEPLEVDEKHHRLCLDIITSGGVLQW